MGSASQVLNQVRHSHLPIALQTSVQTGCKGYGYQMTKNNKWCDVWVMGVCSGGVWVTGSGAVSYHYVCCSAHLVLVPREGRVLALLRLPRALSPITILPSSRVCIFRVGRPSAEGGVDDINNI